MANDEPDGYRFGLKIFRLLCSCQPEIPCLANGIASIDRTTDLPGLRSEPVIFRFGGRISGQLVKFRNPGFWWQRFCSRRSRSKDLCPAAVFRRQNARLMPGGQKIAGGMELVFAERIASQIEVSKSL
jgi:hypothetical protein